MDVVGELISAGGETLTCQPFEGSRVGLVPPLLLGFLPCRLGFASRFVSVPSRQMRFGAVCCVRSLWSLTMDFVGSRTLTVLRDLFSGFAQDAGDGEAGGWDDDPTKKEHQDMPAVIGFWRSVRNLTSVAAGDMNQRQRLVDGVNDSVLIAARGGRMQQQA